MTSARMPPPSIERNRPTVSLPSSSSAKCAAAYERLGSELAGMKVNPLDLEDTTPCGTKERRLEHATVIKRLAFPERRCQIPRNPPYVRDFPRPRRHGGSSRGCWRDPSSKFRR